MRHVAWSLALASLGACYLAPDKYDENGVLREPARVDDAGMPIPGSDATAGSSCTSALACSADAPLCTDGACVGCTQHEQCARFPNTPACGPQGTCVPCTADEARTCAPATPVCDPTANQCVQCLDDAQCGDPKRSACNATSHACEPCATSDDCAHFTDRKVCSEGACVECTRGNLQACSESVRGSAPIQYVCNPVSNSCDRSRVARSKQVCDPCISDLECASGSVCVDVPAGAGQRVCQQLRTSSACMRPYVSPPSQQPVLTAEGERVTVCTLGVQTTCEAHRHYRNQRCGTPIAPGSMQDIEGSGNDALCGSPGRDDGYCIWDSVLLQHLCTVSCNNNVIDCPVGAALCLPKTMTRPQNLCSF